MLDRIKGVFKLDVNTFEEIEADESATSQAAMVVLIVAIISGIGSAAASVYMGGNAGTGVIATVLSTLAGWVVWSGVTLIVGTKLFNGQSDMGQMLRVLGFAYAPQMLGIIPCLGAVVGMIWSLAAGFVAVRQGLDLDNTKAFLTIVVGFIAYVVLSAIIGSVFGVGSAGLGALEGLST